MLPPMRKEFRVQWGVRVGADEMRVAARLEHALDFRWLKLDSVPPQLSEYIDTTRRPSRQSELNDGSAYCIQVQRACQRRQGP
jgi:hypothetical protein